VQRIGQCLDRHVDAAHWSHPACIRVSDRGEQQREQRHRDGACAHERLERNGVGECGVREQRGEQRHVAQEREDEQR
jgi:hypothetical protein